MYQKFVATVGLVSFLWIISEGFTPIRRCTDVIPIPHFVQINDCETSPCSVLAGSIANITIKFSTVDNSLEGIHSEAVAYVNDNAFPLQVPMDYSDVCKHLDNDAHCPLNSGDNVTYSLILPLDEHIPDIFAEVEIALVDENRNCLSCFVADVQVKADKYHPDEE